MKFEPRPYQASMMQHVYDLQRCGLWAGMGLGKTSTTLSAIALENEFVQDGRTLVLAPKRVAQSTWPDEVEKWDHLQKAFRVSAIVGTAEERLVAMRRDANLYTTNYENLPWLLENLGTWKFLRVVADESVKLKSFRVKGGGIRAQALGSIAHVGPKQWINLTGIPAPNGLIDLWGQTWFLDAGKRLGRTFTGFQERWFQRGWGEHGRPIPLPYAQEQIQDLVADLHLSVEAKHHFDLPPLIVNNIYIDLPRNAMARYREMEREMFTQIENHQFEAFNAASKSMKCLQLANGAIYLNPDDPDDRRREWKEVHDVKLQALESIVNEAAGMPVLVGYQWKSDLARILKAFPGAREMDDKPQTLRDWNAGKIPLMLAHPDNGHGLNLQDGGNIIAFFGHWWSYDSYSQLIERIGPTRQTQSGHNRSVYLHHIIARDTVDELVMLARTTKRSVNDILMEATRRYRL
jgi:SNF2 family DNA or RNA helicase